MQAKIKQKNGFRPVDVRLNFENMVEYSVFKEIMDMTLTIPEGFKDAHCQKVREVTGINMASVDIKQCARSMLSRIGKRLPKGGK